MPREVLEVRAELTDEISRPAAGVRREVGRLRREVDATTRAGGPLNTRMGEMAKVSDRLTRGIGRLATGLARGLVAGAKLAATALIGVGAAATAGLGAMIKMASDAGETASKFATVFASSAQEMNAWTARMHDQFGITTKELQDAAATFGVFAKAAGVAEGDVAGFSQQMAQAGLDLSSFYNVPVEETFQALRSGLAGEAEPLRRFGIFLSDATLNAYALQQGIGKTTQQMSEAEKVQLRQAYVLANLGDAAGDLTRTQDSLANTTRAVQGRFREAATVIGTAFMPYAEQVMARLNDLGRDVMPRLRDELDGVTAAIDYWGPIVQTRAGDAWAALAAGEGVAQAVNVALGPGLEPVVATVEAVASVIADLWAVLTDLLLPAVAEAGRLIPGFTGPLGVARDLLGLVADNTEVLVPILGGLLAGFTALKAAQLAHNAVTVAGNAITFVRIAATSGLAAATAAATGPTGALAAGTAILNTVMSLNPVVAVVAGLAALTAGLVIAYRRSEGFRSIVEAVWGWIRRLAAQVYDLWRRFTPLGRVVDALGGFRGIVDKVRAAFAGAWRMVRRFIDAIADIDLPEPLRKIADLAGRAGGAVSRVTGWVRDRMGDGPGGAVQGGDALSTVRANMAGLPGLRVTSTYRTPAANRRVGGSPTSYHLDRTNPAVDVGGPTGMLDLLAGRLARTSYRELLWRTRGHFDHVHYAHAGGRVTSRWPTVPGLAADERPAVLQVGEHVTPRGGGGVTVQGPLVYVAQATSEVDIYAAAVEAMRRVERARDERG